jgi:hypothetical protein
MIDTPAIAGGRRPTFGGCVRAVTAPQAPAALSHPYRVGERVRQRGRAAFRGFAALAAPLFLLGFLIMRHPAAPCGALGSKSAAPCGACYF